MKLMHNTSRNVINQAMEDTRANCLITSIWTPLAPLSWDSILARFGLSQHSPEKEQDIAALLMKERRERCIRLNYSERKNPHINILKGQFNAFFSSNQDAANLQRIPIALQQRMNIVFKNTSPKLEFSLYATEDLTEHP